MRRFTALWIVIAAFLLLEVVVRLVPVEYASGAGIFLTALKRRVAESPRPNFDYVILGDSRSLSLNGHAPAAGREYSVHNFSLPGLGPRYFRFFLRKIIRNRSRRPAAVIFSGDPRHFQSGLYTPHHDPDLLYSDSSDDSLATYLGHRLTRRVGYAFSGGARGGSEPALQQMLWDAFSHRYLHLFSTAELAEQFTGAERIYIVSQSVPLWSHIYRYRRAIEHYTVGLQAQMLQTVPIPAGCDTCSGVLRAECHPSLSHPQDNRLMEELIARNQGGINIGDRLKPSQRAFAVALRDRMIDAYIKEYEATVPHPRELHRLLQETRALGIRFVFAEVPNIDAYRTTAFYARYDAMVAQLLREYPHALRVDFPQRWYPREMFIEQVHYSCEGAARLNRDFHGSVLPRIVAQVPPRR